jgi:hypothetical protein
MPSNARPASRPPEEQIGYLLKRLMHQFRHQVEERLRRDTAPGSRAACW